MTDAEGSAYRVAFGKPITPARPDFSMKDKPDGAVEVHVLARTTGELRTLLGQVRKRFPAFDGGDDRPTLALFHLKLVGSV